MPLVRGNQGYYFFAVHFIFILNVIPFEQSDLGHKKHVECQNYHHHYYYIYIYLQIHVMCMFFVSVTVCLVDL